MTIFRQAIRRIQHLILGDSVQSPPPSGQDQILLNRHQVLVENLAAALIIRDMNGAITYCSPFTEVMCGCPLSTIYEGNEDFFARIVHPSDRASFLRSIQLAQMGESFQMRHRFFHNSGFEIWIESRTAPLFDESGRFMASLTLMVDVTSAVRFEEQMQERNQDLQQITSIAAEEIQNEVFTLKGMLALSEDGLPLETMNSAIRASAAKLESLAQGLTEFGKASGEKRELKTVPPVRILQTYQEQQTHLSGHLSITMPDDEIPVIADEEDLLEVLSSLTNYSQALCTDSVVPDIELQLIQDSVETKILHLDSAPQIPETFIDHIFYPKSLEQGTQRTRLGGKQTPFSLSLCQKRMRRMGGTLDFQITEEGKNCFIVTLKSRPSPPRSSHAS